MARFSLHTVGRDRPGIVAKVARTLADLGANLEETNMTILHGQSAIMLVLDVPNINDGRLLEGALEHVAEEFNLFVTVCPMPEEPPEAFEGDSFLISIDGSDHPGLVADVTRALAEIGANVVDLISHPVERDGHPGYVMRLSVVLPADVQIEALETAMATVTQPLQVDFTIRPWAGELAWDAVGERYA